MKFLRNMMFERGLTSFWWQSWSYCPSTDGQVRATQPSLAWCSIAWDQSSREAGGGAGGGGGWRGEKKKRQRPKKLANEASRLERGPFHPPKSTALARFAQWFFGYFTPFFHFFPSAEPGPRLGRRCQYSSSFISNLMIIASPPWHKQDIQFPY